MSARFRSIIAAFLPDEADPNAGGGGGDAAAQAAAAKVAADAATAAAQKAEHDALPEWARTSLTKTNAENAAARIKLKEFDAVAAELKTLKDAQLSETERNVKTATDATARADAAEHRALVLEVASDKGLTAAQAKRLQGKTKADLEADADDLLANFSTSKEADGSVVKRRPNERLRPGGGNTAEDGEETDPIKLAARVPRRY